MQATIRVELHYATEEDYQVLHKAMAARSMTTTIKSDEGVVYKMPPAEYNYEGSLTLSQVLGEAKAAAAVTQRKFAVLVTESNGRMWVGLEQAK